jgi:mono/diheme cytochrome c family protein
MKTPLVYFLICSLLMMFSCKGSKKAALSQSDADRGAASFPGLTLADLEQGKLAYEKNCQTCHGLKRPSAYSESQWKTLVPKMSAMANKNAGTTVVSEDDKTKILQYLITMAR